MDKATRRGAPVTRLVAGLPSTVPFVGPEALERQHGYHFELRLGANESVFGPSPAAREAMRAAVAQVANYGDPENYALRTALAGLHGVTREHISVGSGIDDLLGLIVRTFLEPGDMAVTSLGAYPTFNFHVEGYGGRLHRVPYRDDTNDLDALAGTARDLRARLVYLANPDNPSGSWQTVDALATFIGRLPEECLLVLDEAYSEFAPPEAVLPLDGDDSRLIRLRTFSKAYGMAGARVGYALAAPDVIAAFDKVRLHFGVNLVAQEGALAALGDPGFVAYVVDEVARGRAEYAALARELGLTPLPSATNFVTIDTGGPEGARTTVTALAGRGVFIRMPGAPPLDRCIRVTVGTPEQRAAFAAIFREVWPQLAGE